MKKNRFIYIFIAIFLLVIFWSCKFYPAISEIYDRHITIHFVGNLDNTPYPQYNDYSKLNPSPAYTNFDITKTQPFMTSYKAKYVKFVINKIVLESTEKKTWVGGPPTLLDQSTVVNFLSNTEVLVTNCNDLPKGIFYDKISFYISEVQTIGTDIFNLNLGHDYLTNRVDADIDINANFDPLGYSAVYRVGDKNYFNGFTIPEDSENVDIYMYFSIRDRYYLLGKYDYTYNIDATTGATNSIITNIIINTNARYTVSSLYPEPFIYITNF